MKKRNSQKNSIISSPEWLKVLNKISEGILMNNNFSITTEKISKLLKRHLAIIAAACYMFDDNEKVLALHSFSETRLTGILSLLPQNMHDIKYNIDDKRVLITKALRENTVIQSNKLEDFFYPVVKPKWILGQIQKIIGAKLCMAIPIRINGSPKGIYFIVTKQEEFTTFQLELTQFYANITGIAFEYSKKIKQLEGQYLVEKETSSMLAHELKTPVAIALNSLQMSEDLLMGNQYIQEEIYFVQQAKGAVQKMSRICDSVLAFREVETQKLSMVHEFHIQDNLLPILQKYGRECLKKDLGFNYAFDLQKEKVLCGGVQFEQMVTILLDNALKYTEKGSVEVNVQCDANALRCIVTDTGSGIPKNQREIIFERFYRVRNEEDENFYKTSGIGLGLYIAKRLVQFLNGAISVKDNPKGKGSRFIVEIPIYECEEEGIC